MRIGELAQRLGLETIQAGCVDAEVAGGYTSDLLSDVMSNAKPGSALITIQAHKNTVAVAGLAGLSAIIICNSRPYPADMIEAAAAEGIAVFRTRMNQYETSGRLYTQIEGKEAS